jgi:hypothetical protein
MVRLVCGRMVAIEPVRSPVEGKPCVVAWTTIVDPCGKVAPIRIATARDFLLDSSEGVFGVRAKGLWVIDPAERQPEDLAAIPEGPVEEAIRAAGLPREDPLRYVEVRLEAGDEVAVRGCWRREPSPRAAGLVGYRETLALPTLSPADGRLEIELLVPHGAT